MSLIMRFLSAFVEPTVFLWGVCLVGALFMLKKKRRSGALALALVALFISLVGSRISLVLLGNLEAPYIRKSLEEIPQADVVIMLGGTQEYSKNDLIGFNLTEAGDRILMALEMVRQGKGQALVLGGGGAPATKDDEPSEAQALQNWIERWQLTSVPIMNLGRNANTHEEALKSAELMKQKGWKTAILVTSGYHMKRASAVFRAAGVTVIPAACDFQRPGTHYSGEIKLLPQAEGFKWLNLYLHEKVGWWVYRARGWVKSETNEEATVPVPIASEAKTNSAPALGSKKQN